MVQTINNELSLKDSCRIYPVVLIIGSRVLRKAYDVQKQLPKSYIYLNLNDPVTYADCKDNIDTMHLTQGANDLIIEDVQLLVPLQESLLKRADAYSSALINLVQQQATTHHQKLWQFVQHFDSWIVSHTLISSGDNASSENLSENNSMGITAILPSFTSLKQALGLNT